MHWKCQKCGFEKNAEGSRACEGCGDTKAGVVVLVSLDTGKQLRMAVATQVGRALLGQCAGEDSKFASEPQFALLWDQNAGTWLLRIVPMARNPTYINGKPLGEEGAAIEEGDTISVGPNKMKLQVKIEA